LTQKQSKNQRTLWLASRGGSGSCRGPPKN
jgi:hypothetical protein